MAFRLIEPTVQDYRGCKKGLLILHQATVQARVEDIIIVILTFTLTSCTVNTVILVV